MSSALYGPVLPAVWEEAAERERDAVPVGATAPVALPAVTAGVKGAHPVATESHVTLTNVPPLSTQSFSFKWLAYQDTGSGHYTVPCEK